MYYIVFDLEFNQEPTPGTQPGTPDCPFEIIQIGALKLDSDFKTLASFNRFVKPSIYPEISPFITELTGITNQMVASEKSFSEVYQAFLKFIGTSDTIFCIWGTSDMKELFRNILFYQLDHTKLSKEYINLQPYVSLHFGLPKVKLLRLSSAVESLGIEMPYQFHDAIYDAYYTAEILKKLYHPLMLPQTYHPVSKGIPERLRSPKKTVDYAALLKQFEKMYGRSMTPQEQEVIKLAYKMGRTKQFVH